jgi:hypothetical protein
MYDSTHIVFTNIPTGAKKKFEKKESILNVDMLDNFPWFTKLDKIHVLEGLPLICATGEEWEKESYSSLLRGKKIN